MMTLCLISALKKILDCVSLEQVGRRSCNGVIGITVVEVA
jgi:hypothetical protein